MTAPTECDELAYSAEGVTSDFSAVEQIYNEMIVLSIILINMSIMWR